ADTRPAVTCESKKVASCEQRTTSASLTKYRAPAVHIPWTAHTTGFHIFCHFGLSASPGSSWFQTLSGCPYGDLTSRPALNARLPAARRTTACTDSSSLTARHARAISSHMVRLNALSCSG